MAAGEPKPKTRSEPMTALAIGAAAQEVPVVVALEFARIRLEDVQGAVEHGLVERVEEVGCREVTPDAPHPPAQRRWQRRHRLLHAAPDRLVTVVHVVGRG